MKVKISKRKQEAMERKAAIVNSPQFKEWWMRRKRISPLPRDPYRAYMIDLGIYARLHHDEVWRTRVNWLDRPDIDYPTVKGGFPQGRFKPRRRKPKMPSRKEIKRWKKYPKPFKRRRKPTAYEAKLQTEVDKFTEQYHLPRLRLEFETERIHRQTGGQLKGVGLGATAYMGGFGGIIQPAILIPKEFVASAAKAKTMRGIKAQVESAIWHEAGHHAHQAFGFAIPEELAPLISPPAPRATTIEKERVAWRVAYKHKPPIPTTAWMKKWALGTYLKTSPPHEY